MEFETIGTIIVVLIALGVAFLIFSKFRTEDKSIGDIVESAKAGSQDHVRITVDTALDLCEYVGGEAGCEGELGVEPYCTLDAGYAYVLVAEPTEEGVCIHVRETVG